MFMKAVYAGLAAAVSAIYLTGCAINPYVPRYNKTEYKKVESYMIYDDNKHTIESAFREINASRKSLCIESGLERRCRVALKSIGEDQEKGLGAPSGIAVFGMTIEAPYLKEMVFVIEYEKKKQVTIAGFRVTRGIFHNELKPRFVTITSSKKWQDFYNNPRKQVVSFGYDLERLGFNLKPTIDLIDAVGPLPGMKSELRFKNWKEANRGIRFEVWGRLLTTICDYC